MRAMSQPHLRRNRPARFFAGSSSRYSRIDCAMRTYASRSRPLRLRSNAPARITALSLITAISFSCFPVQADNVSVDPERLAAATERAAARWNELYAGTPKHFTVDMLTTLTSAEWEQTSRSARRRSYIEFIAYELSAFNSDEVIVAYLNTSLVPFLASHHDQYVCLLTEAYYHLSLTPEQIRTNSGHPLEILYDYAYLYGNTAAARATLDIFVDPEHYDVISPTANLNWRSEWAEIDLGCNS